MNRLKSRMKRVEKLMKQDKKTTQKGFITHQAELIRQYLHDEITTDEFSERSEVEHKELTPKEQQYRDDIFNKYLHNKKEID